MRMEKRKNNLTSKGYDILGHQKMMGALLSVVLGSHFRQSADVNGLYLAHTEWQRTELSQPFPGQFCHQLQHHSFPRVSLPPTKTKFEYAIPANCFYHWHLPVTQPFFKIPPPYHSLGCFYYTIVGVPKDDSILEKCLSPYYTRLNAREHKDK